mmetsp:Transcript_91588/g.213006  ORF Transcript_91588/g.213006 Transcript_91588/m.213006 type:complete len:232 (-) Transcript_91588:257-952(-)
MQRRWAARAGHIRCLRSVCIAFGLVEELEELVIVDLPVSCCVCLTDELSHIDTLKCSTQDLPQIRRSDAARLITVKTLKGPAQRGLMNLDARLQCCCKELAVVDFVVMVGVQAMEKRLSLIAIHVEGLLQHLFHLLVGDCASVLRVQCQELLPQFCPVFRRQRPGHHGQHCALEAGGVCKAPQTLADISIKDDMRVLIEILDPEVLQSDCCTWPAAGVKGQERARKVLRLW